MSDARAELEAARQRHRGRSPFGRAAIVATGWLLAVVGIVAALPLPELGLPLMLVGLRLLALRYDWAARAYLPVARLWARLKELPSWAKVAVGVVGVVLVAGLVWWLV